MPGTPDSFTIILSWDHRRWDHALLYFPGNREVMFLYFPVGNFFIITLIFKTLENLKVRFVFPKFSFILVLTVMYCIWHMIYLYCVLLKGWVCLKGTQHECIGDWMEVLGGGGGLRENWAGERGDSREKNKGGGIEFECRQRLNVMRGGAHSL